MRLLQQLKYWAGAAGLAALGAFGGLSGPAAAASAEAAGGQQQCAPKPAAELARLQNARVRIFRNLLVAEKPLYLGNLPFEKADGQSGKVADYRGKTVLLNLWEVWCPPCRREIGDLAALQAAHGGADFQVLTVYGHTSGKERVQAFLAERQAENLPLNRDADGAMQNALMQAGLLRGLPASLIIDKKGCLVASLQGGAPWGNADAWAFISAAQQQ